MSSPEPIAPLISSSVMGPLGARHLPRLWLKLLLDAMGRLPEGYRSGIGGFDEAVCDALGVSAEAFSSYVRALRPSYPNCERWIRANTTGFDHVKIAEFNDSIVTREFDDTRAATRRDSLGLDANSTLKRAVGLNDLDDWHEMHKALTTPAPAPAVNSEASLAN